jgi:hypothetical protein
MLFMLRSTRRAVLCLLTLLISAPSFAEDLAARLQHASAVTNLGGITEKPWYLKLDVTTFDEKGQNPQTGTIEVKSMGEDRHTVFAFGDARHSELRSGGSRYELQRGRIPYFAEVVLSRVLHIGPDADEVAGVDYQLQHKAFNKLPFDCIILGHEMKSVGVISPGVFPAYCLQHDSELLRISYDYGSQLTVVNGMGKFLDHQVPTSITISEAGVTVATAKVTTLGTFTPSAKDLEPAEGEAEVGLMRPKISGNVMSGKLLSRAPLHLPLDVQRRQAHGSVVLRVVIGRDGHVHSIRPMTFPDPDLVALTIGSVRLWTYSPYMLNDIPTDVETTITYNFGTGSVDVIGIRH